MKPADVRERLAAELDGIRAERFAVSTGEVDEGVWACAAPVQARGHLVGAISVVAPAYRVEGKRDEIGEAVRRAARDFEDELARR